jgi:hypothetical protein
MNPTYRTSALGRVASLLAPSRQAVTALLKSFFSTSIDKSLAATLISTPVFKETSNTVTIQLFYYSKAGVTDKALKTLSLLITQLYPANITVDLQIVRLYQPYLNASILAQYIAINASKYGFHRIMAILLNAVPYAGVSTYRIDETTRSRNTFNSYRLAAHNKGCDCSFMYYWCKGSTLWASYITTKPCSKDSLHCICRYILWNN